MHARTLCLGAFARGDASGGEIAKSFEEGPVAHLLPLPLAELADRRTARHEAGAVAE